MSLAIECGATSSSVLYMDGEKELKKFTMGSANFALMSDLELEAFFGSIFTALGKVAVHEIGIGMPGILDDSDKQKVENTVRKCWPKVSRVWVGSDVDTAMACLQAGMGLKVLVIGGTGSNCFGRDEHFQSTLGGCGHLLGDRGSSYAIALKALRLGLREFNYSTKLGDNGGGAYLADLLIPCVIRELKLSSLGDLVTWSTKASKAEIAGVTVKILELSRAGNPTAKQAVTESITELAEDCAQIVKKFCSLRKQPVEIGLTGSLLTRNEDVVEIFKMVVLKEVKAVVAKGDITFTILQDTVQGALKVLRSNDNNNNNNEPKKISGDKPNNKALLSEEELAHKILPVYCGLPQTECRNARSTNLDKMSIVDAIDLMISEEGKIYGEILKVKSALEMLIDKTAQALKSGGRLFYVGAGTSGRLGILDASECPPTFRTPPEMVQGIIAGGFSSVSKAKEGAEDSIIDGMDAMEERLVGSKDVVMGIAASGRTPFVWGAMYQAQLSGAFTTFLTFNVKLDMKIQPDLILAMDLGPEVLTGSTRLKCGSATKCVLNMLSTLVMVRNGKCFENLMIDLNPANEKLKQRALRIVLLMTSNLEGMKEQIALPVLVKNKYDIKSTVLELRQNFG